MCGSGKEILKMRKYYNVFYDEFKATEGEEVVFLPSVFLVVSKPCCCCRCFLKYDMLHKTLLHRLQRVLP